MMDSAQECSRGPKACKSCWIHYVDDVVGSSRSQDEGFVLAWQGRTCGSFGILRKGFQAVAMVVIATSLMLDYCI
jgi:hypothetical protein